VVHINLLQPENGTIKSIQRENCPRRLACPPTPALDAQAFSPFWGSRPGPICENRSRSSRDPQLERSQSGRILPILLREPAPVSTISKPRVVSSIADEGELSRGLDIAEISRRSCSSSILLACSRVVDPNYTTAADGGCAPADSKSPDQEESSLPRPGAAEQPRSVSTREEGTPSPASIVPPLVHSSHQICSSDLVSGSTHWRTSTLYHEAC